MLILRLILYGVNPRLSPLKVEHTRDQQIQIQTETTTDFIFKGSVRKFNVLFFIFNSKLRIVLLQNQNRNGQQILKHKSTPESN